MTQLLPDEPTITDKLGYEVYADGLADLILKCDTPMTIGIHGKWGTGKTSLMKMIKERLLSLSSEYQDIRMVWFNPWQFQFEESAVIPMLHAIRDEAISQSWLEGARLKTLKIFNVLGSLAGEAVLRACTGGTVTSDAILRQGIAFEEKYFEAKTVAQRLHEHFNSAVSSFVGKRPLARLVIFIDDLDRCLPEFVLKTLESIKLFLNVKRCVFLIAIDADVVQKALAQRYGEKVSFETHNYLEKIIQLPFHIPTMFHDQVQGFIESLSSDKELYDYLEIVVEGVDGNPRYVKRFLNSLTLHDLIAQRIEIKEYDKRVMAKLLVLQYRWPVFYRNFSVLIDLERTVLEKKKQAQEDLLKREKGVLGDIDVAALKNFLENKPYFSKVKNISDYISMSRLSTHVKAQIFTEEIRMLNDIDVRQALKTGLSLAGFNMRGLNLMGLDFSRADLRGANFVSANLSNSKFVSADLTGSNLERAILDFADIEDAKLSLANLWRASLEGLRNLDKVASLHNANFYQVEGLNDDQKKILAKHKTLDIADYIEFFEFYQDKQGMTDNQIRKVFPWREHSIF